MKKYIIYIITGIVLSSLYSCSENILEEPSTSKKDIFEDCWKTIDERYSYFELKGINWNAAHTRFANNITEDMSDDAFFDSLSVMLDLLKDGHSGLKSNFNYHGDMNFFINRPENFNSRLILDHYIKNKSIQTGSITHAKIGVGNIAYLRYSSFEGNVTDQDMNYILEKNSDCIGIIIDIRNNFGGSIDNAFMIGRYFTGKSTKVFTSYMKSGPNHNQFSSGVNSYLNSSGVSYNKTVCILTNRKTYSAGSLFTLMMRELPNVTIVGDTTGGGLGLPVGKELGNGWQVSFAGSKTLSASGENFEMGIPPDVQVNMSKSDEDAGIDSIIEKAIDIILN